MQTTRTFAKIAAALSESPRYIDNRGGARSGKTYAELQLAAILAAKDKTPTITSVVSENLPHLKRGAIRDFRNAMADMGLWNENRWSRQENIYTFATGSIIEFFGADVPGKLQGPARDRLIINEANRVDWEAARQLMVRTANKGTGNWWRVYGLGLIGQVEGQVFDFKVVDDMPDPAGFIETWGLDFGFTNDPTTVIRCLVHTGRREIYADQLCWQAGMTNPDIADALKDYGIKAPGNGPTVWADCAEPKSIEEVKRYGVNIKACDKRTAVREQIQALQPWTIYVTRRSVDLINEGRKYLFKQRPDGTWTNEPIDFFNHGIDALRYACYTGVVLAGARGSYTIGFNR